MQARVSVRACNVNVLGARWGFASQRERWALARELDVRIILMVALPLLGPRHDRVGGDVSAAVHNRNRELCLPPKKVFGCVNILTKFCLMDCPIVAVLLAFCVTAWSIMQTRAAHGAADAMAENTSIAYSLPFPPSFAEVLAAVWRSPPISRSNVRLSVTRLRRAGGL